MHSSAVVLALVGLVAFPALAVPVEGTTYDRDVHDFASRGDEILDSRGQGDFDLSGQIGQFFNNHHLGFLNNIRRDDLVGQSDLSSSSDVLNRILDLFPADSQGQTLGARDFLGGLGGFSFIPVDSHGQIIGAHNTKLNARDLAELLRHFHPVSTIPVDSNGRIIRPHNTKLNARDLPEILRHFVSTIPVDSNGRIFGTRDTQGQTLGARDIPDILHHVFSFIPVDSNGRIIGARDSNVSPEDLLAIAAALSRRAVNDLD